MKKRGTDCNLHFGVAVPATMWVDWWVPSKGYLEVCDLDLPLLPGLPLTGLGE